MGTLHVISRRRREDNRFLAFAVVATTTAAIAFVGPAMRVCRGDFPVPLDDVFIHFDFARSLCRGHPFEWIAGQGFSSGETSPLYAALMAVGYAAGLGEHLAWFSALVAWASVVWAMASLRALSGARPLVAFAGAALLVCVGALDFTLFSGMEFALFIALVLRAFVLADRVVRAPPWTRSKRQWALGAWGVLLVWTRPESAVVIAVLAVLAARHARAASPLAALLRVSIPGACATLVILGLDWWKTGDPMAAGARLKLLASNPYLGDVDRAREVGLNAFYFVWKVVLGSMVPSGISMWLLGGCVVAAVVSRATRELGVAMLVSAMLWAVLVSQNGAARYQGFRYYAPAVALVLAVVALGLAALARRFGAWAAIAVGAVLGLGAAFHAGNQVRFFRDASANIHDQQVAVGKKLRGLDLPGVMLVNDAGAIPYFADRGAIDALGLGGFHGLPFTRAALSGEASTVELIQRMTPAERPTLLALYPNWFPGITGNFAREVDRVTIEHNVICGGPTKLIAVADWSALDGDQGPPGVIDELDVADVESERAHAYESPAPRGGYVLLEVHDGLFDGGRIIPEGERESFRALAASPRARLVLRSDADVDAEVRIAGASVALAASGAGTWSSVATSAFSLTEGERIEIRARRALRDFHVWLVSAR